MALSGGFRYVTIEKRRNALKWLTFMLLLFVFGYLYIRLF